MTDLKTSEKPERESKHAKWELEEGAEIAPGRSILKSLGGGSRYEVFLVWDEGMHAILVAKLLRPDQVEDDKALKDLREEAELLEAIQHPVIVRGFGAILDGTHPHVLIEHLEGPSLRRLIKREGKLPLQQLLPLALNLAGALHHLAGTGIVHLDVKPDNIIVGVPPRLIDLSVARTVDRAARISGPVGTDAYMAPEQCDPKGHPGMAGPASDVWGLGATLHHCVSGNRPFPRPKEARDSDDPLVRFPQLHTDPEPLPQRLPAELHELITEMLDRDPTNRPPAAEVAARLLVSR